MMVIAMGLLRGFVTAVSDENSSDANLVQLDGLFIVWDGPITSTAKVTPENYLSLEAMAWPCGDHSCLGS